MELIEMYFYSSMTIIHCENGRTSKNGVNNDQILKFVNSPKEGKVLEILTFAMVMKLSG